MRDRVFVLVWLYMMASVITEVAASYTISGFLTKSGVVGLLAASQAVAVILFYMDL